MKKWIGFLVFFTVAMLTADEVRDTIYLFNVSKKASFRANHCLSRNWMWEMNGRLIEPGEYISCSDRTTVTSLNGTRRTFSTASCKFPKVLFVMVDVDRVTGKCGTGPEIEEYLNQEICSRLYDVEDCI